MKTKVKTLYWVIIKVNREYRGLGLSHLLYEAVEDFAIKNGFNKIAGYIPGLNNEPLLKLVSCYGFKFEKDGYIYKTLNTPSFFDNKCNEYKVIEREAQRVPIESCFRPDELPDITSKMTEFKILLGDKEVGRTRVSYFDREDKRISELDLDEY